MPAVVGRVAAAPMVVVAVVLASLQAPSIVMRLGLAGGALQQYLRRGPFPPCAAQLP